MSVSSYELNQIQTNQEPVMRFADMGDVHDFVTNTKREIGKVVFEETAQIEDAAVASTTRKPVVFIGPPGSAKTEYLKALQRQFTDADERDFVTIPGISDITPTSLIGGSVETEFESADGLRIERRRIPGIIHPKTVFIKGDEFPRMSKKAREALMPVLEEGIIRSTDGEVRLSRLLGFVATMNPAKREHRLEVADASRFISGILFDAEDAAAQKRKSIRIADDDEKQPVQPFISVEEYRAIQNTVIYNKDSRGRKVVNYSQELKERAYEYQLAIQGLVLFHSSEKESTSRMSGQMARLARAYAMSQESEHIKDNHLLRAAQSMAGSRVAILSKDADLETQFAEVKDSLAAV